MLVSAGVEVYFHLNSESARLHILKVSFNWRVIEKKKSEGEKSAIIKQIDPLTKKLELSSSGCGTFDFGLLMMVKCLPVVLSYRPQREMMAKFLCTFSFNMQIHFGLTYFFFVMSLPFSILNGMLAVQVIKSTARVRENKRNELVFSIRFLLSGTMSTTVLLNLSCGNQIGEMIWAIFFSFMPCIIATDSELLIFAFHLLDSCFCTPSSRL